jgi:hypothetical protein
MTCVHWFAETIADVRQEAASACPRVDERDVALGSNEQRQTQGGGECKGKHREGLTQGCAIVYASSTGRIEGTAAVVTFMSYTGKTVLRQPH